MVFLKQTKLIKMKTSGSVDFPGRVSFSKEPALTSCSIDRNDHISQKEVNNYESPNVQLLLHSFGSHHPYCHRLWGQWKNV